MANWREGPLLTGQQQRPVSHSHEGRRPRVVSASKILLRSWKYAGVFHVKSLSFEMLAPNWKFLRTLYRPRKIYQQARLGPGVTTCNLWPVPHRTSEAQPGFLGQGNFYHSRERPRHGRREVGVEVWGERPAAPTQSLQRELDREIAGTSVILS